MKETRLYTCLLIMLECRLSLEDASEVFKINRAELEEYLKDGFKNLDQRKAIDYLLYEASVYPEDNKKGKLKAATYYRRFLRILEVKDSNERLELLKSFIKMLSGPNIIEFLSAGHKYSREQQEQILKYRVKYCKNNRDITSELNISHNVIQRWENNLPESELKTRLGILRGYTNYIYHSKKPRR